MGIGTDTYPHNMLDEMRLAAYLARTQATDPRSLTTTELFEAATIGGARALGREDIGRLATGCRADFVLVDITHPMMRPARDPIRSPDLRRRRPRAAVGLCRWPQGGAGWRGADHGLPRRRRASA